MTRRDEKIYEEAAALWTRLYSEPPPQGADAHIVLDMILRGLPDTSYGRLHTPHLRPAAIVIPKA